ncbi:MAG: hypothetical protein ACKPKO_24580, partial [Candidatus Fonsibacter sp.]
MNQKEKGKSKVSKGKSQMKSDASLVDKNEDNIDLKALPVAVRRQLIVQTQMVLGFLEREVHEGCMPIPSSYGDHRGRDQGKRTAPIRLTRVFAKILVDVGRIMRRLDMRIRCGRDRGREIDWRLS